jgi:hypothetical protein
MHDLTDSDELGADLRFRLKEELKALLTAVGHDVVDFGTEDESACDLVDFAHPAALAVGRGEVDRAILVDGVGYGSAMIANRIRGVDAVVCRDPILRGPRAIPLGQQRALPGCQGRRLRDRGGCDGYVDDDRIPPRTRRNTHGGSTRAALSQSVICGPLRNSEPDDDAEAFEDPRNFSARPLTGRRGVRGST